MAFHELMFKENLTPAADNKIMAALSNLTDQIAIGQKHIKSEDRQNNIKVTKGLIRDQFVAADVAALSHGPGMIFDFENSIRRSRTETTRYEFKQGLLRLSDKREVDPTIIQTILETICAWREGISSRFNEVWRCTSRINRLLIRSDRLVIRSDDYPEYYRTGLAQTPSPTCAVHPFHPLRGQRFVVLKSRP